LIAEISISKIFKIQIAEKGFTFLAANHRMYFFGGILPPLPSVDVVFIWIGRANVYSQISWSWITCNNRLFRHLQKSIIAIEASSAVEISD
jgi:hypothetical protein